MNKINFQSYKLFATNATVFKSDKQRKWECIKSDEYTNSINNEMITEKEDGTYTYTFGVALSDDKVINGIPDFIHVSGVSFIKDFLERNIDKELEILSFSILEFSKLKDISMELENNSENILNKESLTFMIKVSDMNSDDIYYFMFDTTICEYTKGNWELNEIIDLAGSYSTF